MSPYRHVHPLLGLRPWRRHSLVLAGAAVVYIVYGISLVTFEPAPGRARGLALAFTWFPPVVWGMIWIIVGILAFLSTRWPPTSEIWGYVAMSGLSGLWAACYGVPLFLSYMFHPVVSFFGLGGGGPSIDPGVALPGLLVWGMVAFMWWGIAGLHNPEEIFFPEEEEEGAEQ